MMEMPLEGIRVIDWTLFQHGPSATAMLADMGAEVVKIEDRIDGDPARKIVDQLRQGAGISSSRNIYFEMFNRNKKSMTLDLKKEKARAILYRLVERSDVFLHNFRPEVADRLLVGYETLSQYNPRLVYACGTGYGPSGPDLNKPVVDLIAMGRSGAMDAFSSSGMPPQWPPGAIADEVGSIVLALSVLAALQCVNRTGIGQEVNTSILASMMWLQQLNINALLMVGQEQPKFDRTNSGNPIFNYYRCSDGKWILLALWQSDRFWPDFCDALELKEMEKDERFADAASREKNCKELIAILEKSFASKSSAHWALIFKKYPDMVFDFISSISDLSVDQQVLANNYIIEFDHPHHGKTKMVGFPISFNKTPFRMRMPAPELGQHTEEVLSNVCGYSREEIFRFKEEKLI